MLDHNECHMLQKQLSIYRYTYQICVERGHRDFRIHTLCMYVPTHGHQPITARTPTHHCQDTNPSLPGHLPIPTYPYQDTYTSLPGRTPTHPLKDTYPSLPGHLPITAKTPTHPYKDTYPSLPGIPTRTPTHNYSYKDTYPSLPIPTRTPTHP